MPPVADFGELLSSWVADKPAITGLVLIGSRERATTDEVWRADSQSDWDFHLITSNPDLFLDSGWTNALSGADLRVYAARMTRIGSVPKVAAVFGSTEVDLVVIPSRVIGRHRWLARIGWHRRLSPTRQFLQDLAVVVRPGFRFLKDTGGWERFYRFAIGAVTDARISNEAARKIADGFVCDYIWAVRKVERGEFFSAQRMLHRELAEANFRLLHELKLRRGERSFPEARRIERVARPEELAKVGVESSLTAASLSAALEKSVRACRELMADLVGEAWNWPKLGH